MDAFVRAVELAAAGAVAESRQELLKTRGSEIQHFYIEHAQNAHRFRVSNRRRAPAVVDLDPVRRVPASMEHEVLERDGYHCRYCGSRVVVPEVLRAYARAVDPDCPVGEVFPVGRTNATRHGIMLGFRATADHLVPHRNGGATHPDNLVTSCWPCNYGKASFTLEDLGLDDPRDRPFTKPLGWVGLTEHLPALGTVADGQGA